MKPSIPINTNVLMWARETAGLEVEAVARRMNKEVKEILSWESGESTPTYLQLETLAYKIYKRPIAIFFFPEPPLEETPKQSFRMLPDEEIMLLTPHLRYIIRQAQVMQMNLSELNDNTNPALDQILRDLKPKTRISPVDLASKVRKYLGIELETQFSWKDLDVAFKSWRNILEGHGVFVFKEAFKNGDFSGFCLYDKQFPVIYVNNSKSDSRQIFTILHELAHLLFGIGGVDTRLDDYYKFLNSDAKYIEVLCNRFVGEFLVPDADFDKRISRDSADDKSIVRLAKLYSVSREVILRKFLDRNIVDQRLYERKVEQWSRKPVGKPRKGGDYYLTKGVYLGERYIEKAFSKFYQKRISVEQLAEYLNVKVRNVSGMESLLYDKGAKP